MRDRSWIQIRSGLCLLIATASISGCYASRSTRIPNTPEGTHVNSTVIRETSPALMEYNDATIGDVMFLFVEKIRTIAPREIVPLNAGRLRRLPLKGWRHTHEYTGKEAVGSRIFTNVAWHKGLIGIVVDDSGRTATSRSFLQVEGLKIGRNWRTPKGIQALKDPIRVTDAWAIRFGGKRSEDYYFELINKVDPMKTEILQDFFISPESLTSGFTVRKVRMRGEPLDDGAVRFQVLEIPKVWQAGVEN